ncbi:MAG: stage V sporulation protein E [Armatimonadia bacterium]|nr:stage V sporulation protein E [Armatimonadia bacterium]
MGSSRPALQEVRPVDSYQDRGRHDQILFVAVCVLSAIGLVMVYSASYAYASRQGLDPEAALERQMLAVAIGLLALVVFSYVPSETLRRLAPFGFIIALVLLVAALMTQAGPEGTRRWIQVMPGLTLQPSAVACVALVVLLAAMGQQYAGEPRKYETFLLRGFIAVGAVCVLIVRAPDLSMMFLAGVSGLAVLLVAGVQWRHILFGVGAWLVVALVLALTTDYMGDRVREFIEALTGGEPGYQVTHALIALGSGGWVGKGLCQGVEKFGYLPEVHNDMIFAAIGEELGLVMTLLVVALYALILIRGYRAALGAPTLFGRYLAMGLTTLIAAQATVNMLVVTGAAPVTGVPLPFVSAGGSSIAVLLGATGLILSISREYADEPREVVHGNEDSAGDRGHGGPRVSRSRRGGFATRIG